MVHDTIAGTNVHTEEVLTDSCSCNPAGRCNAKWHGIISPVGLQVSMAAPAQCSMVTIWHLHSNPAQHVVLQHHHVQDPAERGPPVASEAYPHSAPATNLTPRQTICLATLQLGSEFLHSDPQIVSNASMLVS